MGCGLSPGERSVVWTKGPAYRTHHAAWPVNGTGLPCDARQAGSPCRVRSDGRCGTHTRFTSRSLTVVIVVMVVGVIVVVTIRIVCMRMTVHPVVVRIVVVAVPVAAVVLPADHERHADRHHLRCTV